MHISLRKNILIIEDAINNLLEDNLLPPIAAAAPEQVTGVASLFKTIAPGLRTAFIYVPETYRCNLAAAWSGMNISNPALFEELAGLLFIKRKEINYF